ncbi:MAG: response regulator [Gemmatimonas sp.]|nr:response regulator [Gemmatimonas sp.]
MVSAIQTLNTMRARTFCMGIPGSRCPIYDSRVSGSRKPPRCGARVGHESEVVSIESSGPSARARECAGDAKEGMVAKTWCIVCTGVRLYQRTTPAVRVRELMRSNTLVAMKYILVVDHCAELAEAAAGVLVERMFDTQVALSPLEAVASLGDIRPDLVVLNLGMPGGEAYQVLSVLRLTDGASIPILAIAGTREERARWGPTPIGMEFVALGATVEETADAVERIIGPSLLDNGCRCALCNGVSRESALTFVHLRKGERASLDVPLCESCGNRVEKHLKRVIPKRLMDFTDSRYGDTMVEAVK